MLEYGDSFDTYTSFARRYPGAGGFIIAGLGGGGAATGYNGDTLPIPVSARSEYYFGFDWKSLATAGKPFLNIVAASGATICTFSNSAGTIQTTFGNTPVVQALNTWYQVQVYIKRDSTAGALVVRVDGVTVLNLTGLNTGASDIGSLQFVFWNSQTDVHSIVDNLWIFNTLGSHSNTWPVGRMNVRPLMPNADGSYSAWTPNSGTTHYDKVNEVPADDDTTYNSAITVGAKDSQHIAALPGGIAHVHGVQVTAIARKDDVDPKNFQVFSKSGGVETFSADIDAPLNYASTTVNGVAALLHPDDPNTGAEWTVAAVNALEIGVKVTV